MKIYVCRASIGCGFSSVQLLDFIFFCFSSFGVLLTSAFRHRFDAFEASEVSILLISAVYLCVSVMGFGDLS